MIRHWEGQESEILSSVIAAIDDCSAFRMWQEVWPRLAGGHGLPYGGPELIADAARFYSYLSLRKIDDFLRLRRSKPDDLHWTDYGVDRSLVLAHRSTLLTSEQRVLINKAVAHLTKFGHLEVEELDMIADALASAKPCLTELRSQLQARLDGLLASENFEV